MSEAKFYVGQIIHHTKFSYRGVIFGVDATFQHTNEWYAEMATSNPPKDKPWYHVLVDQAGHMTYVAEQNIEQSTDTGQIEHPMLGLYFSNYNGKSYGLRKKKN